MKTPWRFMADLVSRRPKADRTDKPGHEPSEVKALGYSPVDEPARKAESVISERPAASRPTDDAETQAAPAAVAAEEQVVNTDPAQASTDTDIGIVTKDAPVDPLVIASNDTAVAEANCEVADSGSERKVQPRRKTAVAATDEVGDSRKAPAKPSSTERPKTFVEDMTGLDAEVSDLRSQLATKLAEQNAQLRKMLARFEKP